MRETKGAWDEAGGGLGGAVVPPHSPVTRTLNLVPRAVVAAGAGFVCLRAHSGLLRREQRASWSYCSSTLPRREDGGLDQSRGIISDGQEVRPTRVGDWWVEGLVRGPTVQRLPRAHGSVLVLPEPRAQWTGRAAVTSFQGSL